jgi:hypothetical protein
MCDAIPAIYHHERKKQMNPNLFIGIASKHDVLEVATQEPGKAAITMTFPATVMGVEALRQFLASRGHPIRMAVAGVAALSIALALGNVPFRETYIVSSAVASRAVELVGYAEHAV